MALAVMGSGILQRATAIVAAYNNGCMIGGNPVGKMRRIRHLACLTVAAAALSGQTAYNGIHRIVAVGDVHGDFDGFVAVLRAAGVIDKSNKWIGGQTHLVQTGDSIDRGPDSRKVLELLLALEKQAPASHGMVHALLGNHETMNIYGDLRYVTASDYSSYRTRDSEELRDRAYETLADPAQSATEGYRKKWYDEHPLGWVEQRQAFAPDGKFGRVLREHDAVVKINDILFLHGGITQKYVTMPIAEMNQKIRAELRDFRLLEGGIIMDSQGPLWDRGLADDPELKDAALVDSVLQAYGVSHVVIGHTPTKGAVLPRFGGKVILIDVGLSKVYNQAPVCLIVEDGKLFAMHRGTKLALPEGTDPGAYLMQAAELDPPGSNLRKSLGMR